MPQRNRRQVTITDVASRAGVSLGTASRALNAHPSVELNLRERVLQAAKDLGYLHRPRQNNTPLLTPLTDGLAEIPDLRPKVKHLAFCCRSEANPLNPTEVNNYFSLVLQGVEAECRRRHLQLSYRVIEDDVKELEHVRELLDVSKVEALLLVNFIDHELVRGLLELEKPALLIDHFFPDLPLDVVMNDSYEGAVQAIQYLLGNGHRRIAFVNGPPHHTIRQRFDAYRRTLEAAGIVFEPDWVLQGDLEVLGGQAAGEEFLSRKLDCTAVFCANDSTAFGFMQVMAQHGVRVPQEVSVVGFDDVPAANYVWPALTTVRANAFMIGQIAVHRLLERLAYPTLPITRTLVHAELVLRASVQALV